MASTQTCNWHKEDAYIYSVIKMSISKDLSFDDALAVFTESEEEPDEEKHTMRDLSSLTMEVIVG